MTARESSIVDSIERRARRIPGLLLRKRHGTAFGVAGDPDLSGSFRGRHVEIEVKQPGEEPTPLQKRRMAEWQRAGAMVLVCRSADEFEKWLCWEAQARCSVCNSPNVDVLPGCVPTGVIAPDNIAEWRDYLMISCRDCGAREER